MYLRSLYCIRFCALLSVCVCVCVRACFFGGNPLFMEHSCYEYTYILPDWQWACIVITLIQYMYFSEETATIWVIHNNAVRPLHFTPERVFFSPKKAIDWKNPIATVHWQWMTRLYMTDLNVKKIMLQTGLDLHSRPSLPWSWPWGPHSQQCVRTSRIISPLKNAMLDLNPWKCDFEISK